MKSLLFALLGMTVFTALPLQSALSAEPQSSQGHYYNPKADHKDNFNPVINAKFLICPYQAVFGPFLCCAVMSFPNGTHYFSLLLEVPFN